MIRKVPIQKRIDNCRRQRVLQMKLARQFKGTFKGPNPENHERYQLRKIVADARWYNWEIIRYKRELAHYQGP